MAVFSSSIDQRKRSALFLSVATLHVAIVICLMLIRPDVRFPPDLQLPPMNLILARPIPPSPPQADTTRSAGGAPAAASRVHRPPIITPQPLELPAPETLAPLPELVVGVADAPEATGWGQGGVGEGTGSGTGAGRGAGQGRGAGPQLIHGPAGAVMSANVDPAALDRLPGPYAVLHCYVQSGDPRLRSCRVTREFPVGSGVGEAARAMAAEFRYRPPARMGRAPRRDRQIIAIAFPPSTTFPLER